MDFYTFCTALVLQIYIIVSIKAEHLNITTLFFEPYLVKTFNEKREPVYTGYIKELLDELSTDIGFNYSLHEPSDRLFGTKNPVTGNWSGTINEIISGRADMVAAPLTVTAKRDEVVTFAHPFQTVNIVIVLKKPDDVRLPVEQRIKQVWAPFESSVWLLAFAAYLITSSAIYIISYYNPYDWRRMAHDGEATIREAESFTCLNSFWFSISAITLQGYVRTPRSMGARLVVTAWWLFVIVFISCYISKLTSLLQMRPNEKQIEGYMKINGLEDVAKQNIQFMVIKEGAVQDFLKQNTKQDYIKRLKEELVDGGRGSSVTSPEEAMEKLENYPAGKRAFVTESMLVRFNTQKQGCKFYYVNENMTKRQYSFAFTKNSLMAQKVGQYILRYHQEGLLQSLEKKWFPDKCKEFVLEGTDEKYKFQEFYPLDPASFAGVLIALAVGLVVGIIVSVIECIVFKWAESAEHNSGTIKTNTGENTVSSSLLEKTNSRPDTQV